MGAAHGCEMVTVVSMVRSPLTRPVLPVDLAELSAAELAMVKERAFGVLTLAAHGTADGNPFADMWVSLSNRGRGRFTAPQLLHRSPDCDPNARRCSALRIDEDVSRCMACNSARESTNLPAGRLSWWLDAAYVVGATALAAHAMSRVEALAPNGVREAVASSGASPELLRTVLLAALALSSSPAVSANGTANLPARSGYALTHIAGALNRQQVADSSAQRASAVALRNVLDGLRRDVDLAAQAWARHLPSGPMAYDRDAAVDDAFDMSATFDMYDTFDMDPVCVVAVPTQIVARASFSGVSDSYMHRSVLMVLAPSLAGGREVGLVTMRRSAAEFVAGMTYGHAVVPEHFDQSAARVVVDLLESSCQKAVHPTPALVRDCVRAATAAVAP